MKTLKFFCMNNVLLIVLLIVDVLLIGETKLDSSFPDAQFFIEGYNKPLRLDVSGMNGGQN